MKEKGLRRMTQEEGRKGHLLSRLGLVLNVRRKCIFPFIRFQSLLPSSPSSLGFVVPLFFINEKRIVDGDNELGRKDEEAGFRGKRLQIFIMNVDLGRIMHLRWPLLPCKAIANGFHPTTHKVSPLPRNRPSVIAPTLGPSTTLSTCVNPL
ncbi:hypothetical protein V8G54_031178 [Vigna mungo]|uniref:Uncharacterized protein n=1 Tax=Vigna mungo TaxID=3915 RepID=A0AAQ3RN20_VIGMU